MKEWVVAVNLIIKKRGEKMEKKFNHNKEYYEALDYAKNKIQIKKDERDNAVLKIGVDMTGSRKMQLTQEMVKEILPVLKKFADTGEL